MKIAYPVVFTQEKVGYSTVVPDLSGCFSEGDTFENACKYTKEAIELYLEGEKDYPPASVPAKIKLKQNQLLSLIEVTI